MARRRFTPADLADAIGVHRVTASAIYNGRTSIDIERLDAIAGWLDLTASDLYAGSLRQSSPPIPTEAAS